MVRRTLQVLGGVVALLLGTLALGSPAHAVHDHFVNPPNGKCHQVAQGQTALQPEHGGWHRYHVNVHWGATDAANEVLGMGNSQVRITLACPDT